MQVLRPLDKHRASLPSGIHSDKVGWKQVYPLCITTTLNIICRGVFLSLEGWINA